MTTPDQDESTTRTLDPINPYAVIALVAALLGLFPIAIVFGILAFTRPAGRGIAITGLVLGIIELAAVLFVIFGAATAFTDNSSDGAAPARQAAPSSSTTYSTTTPETSNITVPTSSPVQDTPVDESPTRSDEATPAVEIGEYCTTPDAQAATTDGSTAYCSRRAGTDAYLWAPKPGVIPNPDLPQQTTETSSAGDAPAIGSPCATSELGQIRPSASGQRVKCGYTGEDSLLWLAMD